MPDPFANITDVDLKVQEVLAEPRQQEMLQTYFGWTGFPEGAGVLDVGCGTGATTRVLARWPGRPGPRGARILDLSTMDP